MKCQGLCSGKTKKKDQNFTSSDYAHRVVNSRTEVNSHKIQFRLGFRQKFQRTNERLMHLPFGFISDRVFALA